MPEKADLTTADIAKFQRGQLDLRRELAGRKYWIQSSLDLLPAQNPSCHRLRECWAFTLMQMDCIHPDTQLAHNLLDHQRQLVSFFSDNMHSTLICRQLCRGWDGELRDPTDPIRSLEDIHMIYLQSCWSLINALNLASLILAERNLWVPAGKLNIAMHELNGCVRPNEHVGDELLEGELISVDPEWTLEQEVKKRKRLGYRQHLKSTNEGPVFLFQKAGAWVVLEDGREDYEVDFSIVTQDRKRHPDPKYPAMRMSDGSGVDRFLYTDQRGCASGIAYCQHARGFQLVN